MMISFKLIFTILLNMFMYIKFPMQKIMIFILNMLIMLMFLSYMMKFYWFFLMFVILMLGGLMVLFIYFTSLSNNTHYHSYSWEISLSKILFLLMVVMILMKFLLNENYMFYVIFKENSFINIYCSVNSNILILFLIFYMLLMLIIDMELLKNYNVSFRMF